jgi:hypothetical protein
MLADDRANSFSGLSDDARERFAHIEVATTIFFANVVPAIYGMSFIDRETIGSGG